MTSVRRAKERIDELKQNGFEDNQATVLAMAVDETVEDRLEDVMSRIDARFDAQDAKFDARFDAQDAKFDARFDVLDAKSGSRKYETAVITATFCAALIAIGVATYGYLIKPLLG